MIACSFMALVLAGILAMMFNAEGRGLLLLPEGLNLGHITTLRGPIRGRMLITEFCTA